MFWNRRLGLTIRVLLSVFLLTGGFLVGLGFALDASPSSALSLTLVAVGVWTLISAAFGLCGSFRAECCLKTYLILSSAALILQAVGLLFVFISLDSMIDHMASNSKEKKKAIDVLEKTKWPFLIVLLLEFFGFFLAMLLLCCCDSEIDFEPFESTTSRRRPDLSKIRSSIGRGTLNVESSASAKRLSQRMAQKYGHLSHTTDWSSEKRWWPFG